MKFLISFLLITLGLFTGVCHGMICEEENFFGITTRISCPQYGEPSDAQFCCGSKEDRECCSNPLGLDDKDFQEVAEKLPAILGTLFAIVIGMIVVCIVCCCCCPFCLIHKRRTRGTVHNPNPATAQPLPVMSTIPPGQPGYAPVQTTPYPAPQPYPPQPYPPQPYPPQQGYAAPPQGYMPQPGMVAPPGAPYPIPVLGENPPPYADKQMPFNPNY